MLRKGVFMKKVSQILFAFAFSIVLVGCSAKSPTDISSGSSDVKDAPVIYDGINRTKQSGSYVVIKAGDYYIMGDTEFNDNHDIYNNSFDGNVNFAAIPDGFDNAPLQFAVIDADVTLETGGVDGRMEFNIDEVHSIELLDYEAAVSKIEIINIPRGDVASACLPQIVRFEGEDGVYIFAPYNGRYAAYLNGELYAEYDTLGRFTDVGLSALCSSDMTAEEAKARLEKGEVQSKDFFALSYRTA